MEPLREFPFVQAIPSSPPPPPPPPPPPYPPPPLMQWFPSPQIAVPAATAYPNDARAHLAHRNEQFEKRYDDLRDTRMDLLGTRFRLREMRKELQPARHDFTEKIGSAMDRVQRYLQLHGHEIHLPSEVLATMDQIDASRERLTLLEWEFDEVETGYNDQELQYAQDEDSFVAELLKIRSGDLSTTHHPTLSSARVGTFTVSSFGSEEILTGIYAMETEAYDLLGPIHDVEPSSQVSASLRAFPPDQVTPDMSIYRAKVPPNPENAHEQTLDWDFVKDRINEWLFDVIDSSTMQKAQLKANLERGFGTNIFWNSNAFWNYLSKTWWVEGPMNDIWEGTQSENLPTWLSEGATIDLEVYSMNAIPLAESTDGGTVTHASSRSDCASSMSNDEDCSCIDHKCRHRELVGIATQDSDIIESL